MSAHLVPGCGHDLAALQEIVAADADLPASERRTRRDCASCQAELARLWADWTRVAEAAQVPIPTPPTLLARTTEALRGLWDGGHDLSITQPGGRLVITDRALLTVARSVLREVCGPSVRIRTVTATADGSLHVGVDVRFATAIPETIARLRADTRAQLTVILGTPAPRLDVDVLDVRG